MKIMFETEIRQLVSSYRFSHLFDSDDSADEEAAKITDQILSGKLLISGLSYSADPVKYVQEWIKSRVGEEEYRIPEDALLMIFKKVVLAPHTDRS